jgi:hypothetical protein
MVRWVVFVLWLLIGLALGPPAAVIVQSLQPRPGARMRLMALPVFALPLLPLGAGLLAVAYAGRAQLSRTQFAASVAVGLLTVVPTVLLFALG